jgi:hypothetical protein
MNLYQPTITGSLSVSGSVNISGSITIAGGGTISGTASIATTALTASFVENAQTASYVLNAVSSSFALTASSADNLLVRNTLTAQTLVVQTITSSVDFVTGSTQFGTLLSNTHVFSGSVTMNPNGLFVSSSGNVGIGLTNPGVALDISGYGRVTGIGLNASPYSTGTNPNYVRWTNTGGDLYLGQEGSTSGGFFVGSLAYDSVLYSGRSINSIINGVSRMYINSSGSVGIGNTNPTYRLDIFSGSDFDIRLRDTSLGGTVGILFETANDFSGTSQAYIKGIGSGNSGLSDLILGTAGTSGATSATERMRITSGGNVGIGVTPSDWNTLTPLQIKNVAFAGYTSGNTHVLYAASNFYYGGSGGGDKYIANGYATLYSQADGGHSWYTAGNNASGAGASLSFTERMKITSGGTVFYKGYFGSTLLGGFSVIGTLSAINVADRYLHARINTIGSMMYWIKVFGYVYTTNIIEGLGGGYVGGGTGGVNQAFQNGAIVAQYQNNGYVEIVVDTVNTSTTNRWGSITFLGGSDTIATVQPLEIIAYSWTSTTTRVY